MTKGEVTRTAILDLALDEASLHGLAGLSIGPLADLADMSKSGLFAHFGSKRNLQLAVLEHGVERFVAEVMAPAFRRPRGEPRVRALFDNWLAWVQGRSGQRRDLSGGCVFIGAATEFDDLPGPIHDRVSEYQKEWMEALARACRLAIEEGHFRSDLEPEQFAHDFYSIILAHHHFQRLIADPRSAERARIAFERLMADARSRN
ncbi:MAG: TetR/AcrR family transcriptional regulator [Thermoanaerobaculia bacterium]